MSNAPKFGYDNFDRFKKLDSDDDYEDDEIMFDPDCDEVDGDDYGEES